MTTVYLYRTTKARNGHFASFIELWEEGAHTSVLVSHENHPTRGRAYRQRHPMPGHAVASRAPIHTHAAGGASFPPFPFVLQSAPIVSREG